MPQSFAEICIDVFALIAKMRRVFNLSVPSKSVRWLLLASVAMPCAMLAADPFTSAKVTRLQNDVSVGEARNGHQVERPAALSDVIQASNYLLTKSEARAELQFSDHSLVRVGQNTVFSFDAKSRTLSLQKGAILFYISPGSGGGVIKTPSMTAAVTGTLGLVTPNLIACLQGTLHTKFGDVPAGFSVDSNGNIQKFDWKDVVGKSALVNFGGPPPTLPLQPPLGPENGDVSTLMSEFPGLPDYRILDIQEATQVNPRVRDFLNTSPPKPTPTPPPAVPSPGRYFY